MQQEATLFIGTFKSLENTVPLNWLCKQVGNLNQVNLISCQPLIIWNVVVANFLCTTNIVLKYLHQFYNVETLKKKGMHESDYSTKYI